MLNRCGDKPLAVAKPAINADGSCSAIYGTCMGPDFDISEEIRRRPLKP
jgi:hypothetical protein